MNLLVFITPEKDACARCRKFAYVNEKSEAGGYRFYIVDATSIDEDHPVHPLTCRCKLHVVSGVDGNNNLVSVDEVLDDLQSKELEKLSKRLQTERRLFGWIPFSHTISKGKPTHLEHYKEITLKANIKTLNKIIDRLRLKQ